MKYQFYIVDVFTPEPFGGNQLAVLPNAQGISTAGMQKIAREFNFAESAFVFPPESAGSTARVRIFTPRAEVDFAGHPTVGTACALVYGKHVDTHDLVLEENVGPVGVTIEADGGLLSGTLTNTAPLQHPDDKPGHDMLAKLLSLRSEDVVDGFFAGVGLDFCYAQLANKEAVDRAVLDQGAWNAHVNDIWSSNLFFFSGDVENGAELYARMMAPGFGIEEDPATGSAVAALAGVAASRTGFQEPTIDFSVVQGVKMERKSVIAARAVSRNGALVSVSVGGPTVLVATGEIDVQAEWLD